MSDLKKRLQPMEQLQMPELWVDIERRRPGLQLEEREPRWRRVGIVALALAVFGAAGGVAWVAFEGLRQETPATAADPWAAAPEGWTELPPPPEVRDGAAIVWTGKELVYWGGWPRGATLDEARADGFAFNPDSQMWRHLPPAPIAGGGDANAGRDERGGPGAVWTGSEVIFWDVQSGDGQTSATLALDPATGEWRQLDDAPPGLTCCGAWAWTGQQLIVFGGDVFGAGDRDASTTIAGVALEPATGTWERIAEAPVGMNLANAVWTGEEVIVVGSKLDSRNVAETPTAIAIGYRLSANAWRRLPDAPLSAQTSEAVWFRGRVIAWDGATSAQYLPEEDRWESLGGLPVQHECYVSGVAIEGAVFAWDCGIPDAWYPGLGWTSVEGGPPARQAEIDETVVRSHGRALSAGSVAVVEQVDNIWLDTTLHIGSSEASVHLWIWRPLTPSEVPPPPTAEGPSRGTEG